MPAFLFNVRNFRSPETNGTSNSVSQFRVLEGEKMQKVVFPPKASLILRSWKVTNNGELILEKPSGQSVMGSPLRPEMIKEEDLEGGKKDEQIPST